MWIKYKKIINVKLALIVIVLFSFLWDANSQDREKRNGLGEAFTFESSYTGDFVRNFTGGISKGNAYLGMLDVALSFDSEKSGLWQGGEILIHGLSMHGGTPTADLVGDHQVFSNIESGDFTGLYEFWYKQSFGDLSVLVGQHDLNSEFITCDYGGLYTNSSFGIIGAVPLNVPVPIFPIAAPGIMVKYEPGNFSFLAAGYDGDPGDCESNEYNLNIKMGADEGYLGIGEAQYTWEKNDQTNGVYRVGAYYHSGSFTSISDTLETVEGNLGVYAIVDQTLYREKEGSDEGLCGFVQFAYTPGKQNLFTGYLGCGLSYQGLIRGRDQDLIGLSIATVFINDDAEILNSQVLGFETAIELAYQLNLNEHFYLQPDIQYIINPGTTSGQENALVGLLRFGLSY